MQGAWMKVQLPHWKIGSCKMEGGAWMPWGTLEGWVGDSKSLWLYIFIGIHHYQLHCDHHLTCFVGCVSFLFLRVSFSTPLLARAPSHTTTVKRKRVSVWHSLSESCFAVCILWVPSTKKKINHNLTFWKWDFSVSFSQVEILISSCAWVGWICFRRCGEFLHSSVT